MAVKANGLSACMKIMAETGISFESASLGELVQSLKHAKDPRKLVFDSPVKTKKELTLALENGVYLNIDNWQECDRVGELLATNRFRPDQNIGLRLNPQVGLGRIPAMSTAGQRSKFGIALDDYHEQIVAAYKERPWLNGVHCHIGSQGCPYELVVDGLKKLLDLVEEVNKDTKRIKYIDIGGGLPVNFETEDDAYGDALSFADWRALLEKNFPILFSGEYQVITEYGRRLNNKSAFFISQVEYTKSSGPGRIASIHGGVDLFIRHVYAPDKWPLRVSVFGADGSFKEGELVQQDIAGPCCIAGDLLAVDRWLPRIEAGDHLIVHDTGGYVLSNYSYYNLRQAPLVVGYTRQEPLNFTVLRAASTVEDILSFFE